MLEIPANKPYFPEAEQKQIAAEITKVLSNGRLTQGPWIDKFEQLFAEHSKSSYAIAVNSGTSALEILLRFFNVSGGEVIVPTNTFLASGNAVIFAGGKPVLADISPHTLSLDPEEVRRRITPATRGVIAVHIAGLISPEIHEIREICKSAGLFLIEDAAHAPGASLDGVKAGNLSDGGAFSFYPTKPLTTGEGGMITTNDPDCDHFARSLRCHGIAIGEENSGDNRNLLLRLGYNWRMSEIQAIVGYHQLKRLDEALNKRRQVASWYKQELQGIPGLQLFSIPATASHSFYKYPILLEKKQSRGPVAAAMAKEYNVRCGSIYWPPCHLQPFYMDEFGYKMGDFPVAEDILDRTLALPIYPDMPYEAVQQVSKGLSVILQREGVNV